MKNPKPLIIISVILVVVLVSMIYGYSQYKIYQDEYQGTESTEGEDVIVVIPEGAATKQIAKILKEKGLIQFPSAFVKRVKLYYWKKATIPVPIRRPISKKS